MVPRAGDQQNIINTSYQKLPFGSGDHQQNTIAWGNRNPWSILAVSSRVVLISGVYCEYSPYLRVQYTLDTLVTAKYVFRIFVRRVLRVYSGVLYTAHVVPSNRSIWPVSTADTPGTRSINLGHHNINRRVLQYPQYQRYPEYRTENIHHIKYVQVVVCTFHGNI